MTATSYKILFIRTCAKVRCLFSHAHWRWVTSTGVTSCDAVIRNKKTNDRSIKAENNFLARVKPSRMYLYRDIDIGEHLMPKIERTRRPKLDSPSQAALGFAFKLVKEHVSKREDDKSGPTPVSSSFFARNQPRASVDSADVMPGLRATVTPTISRESHFGASWITANGGVCDRATVNGVLK